MELRKTEMTTSLYDDKYVFKNDPRIVFRGKMDSLIALITLIQSLFKTNELADVLETAYNIMYAEITDTEFTEDKWVCKYGSWDNVQTKSHMIGLLSHNDQYGDFYNILNYLRTYIREVECVAVESFRVNLFAPSIVTALNRLSSVIHIMMYEITIETDNS